MYQIGDMVDVSFKGEVVAIQQDRKSKKAVYTVWLHTPSGSILSASVYEDNLCHVETPEISVVEK